MSEHTQGRLHVHHDHGWLVVTDEKENLYLKVVKGLGTSIDLANARRLVACWNVCEGLSTEVLESILTMGDTMKSRFAMRDKVELDMQQQRYDLIEALKELDRAYVNLLHTGRGRLEDAGVVCDPVDVMVRSDPNLRSARAAIAKATGGQT